MSNPYQENIDKVYFFSDLHYIKIGYTSESLERRLERVQTGSPLKLYILGYILGDKNKEQELHSKFSFCSVRENGEWFSIVPELIEYINENTISNSYIELDEGKLMIYKKTSTKTQ